MKKSSMAAPAALFVCLAMLALLPMYGCGNGAAAKVENAEVNQKAWSEPAVDPNRVVDSVDSWRKFVTEAKQPERMKQAEQKFQEGGPANTVKVVFMKDEMELVQFGDKSKLKGIDPNRYYEVGVLTLAAKENWGANGYQIREYVLKFITPRRDGDWKFIMGTYHISKSTGSWNGDATQLLYVEEKEYQNGYLRQLFVKPLPAGKKDTGGSAAQGGEQPVETNIKPSP